MNKCTSTRRFGVGVAVCAGLLTWCSAAVSSAQSVAPPKAGVDRAAAQQPADATLFRVFLKDGATLASYGEIALVGDRVVFSMPTSSGPAPELQLVSIPADQVEWTRTASYAESARAARYLATRAADDYLQLSNDVTATLNAVRATKDSSERLALVETARRKLAAWPATHYHYREADVQQMLTLLDAAVADLRAAGGGQQFDVSLVASARSFEPVDRLLPPPTLKETIEETLVAARLTDSAADRTGLLTKAADMLERAPQNALPAQWRATTLSATRAKLAVDVQVERQYQTLTTTMLRRASERANVGDVRGVQSVLDDIRAQDRTLGGKRQESVTSLIAAVEAQLDAARQLRLARDHWASRLPVFEEYRDSVWMTLERFMRLQPLLEDIRSLAGPSVSSLATVESSAAQNLKVVGRVTPPTELRDAHALLASAAQMAASAARLRLEAIGTNNMARAWDASAAAAGALMLSTRARTEILGMLRAPQLPR
jgi:hypothetical protein